MRRDVWQRHRRDSFTLVELLTVIAIIAILAGLILFAATGVIKEAARSRAKSEIAGLSSAMESYKSDNGVYPSFPNGKTSLFSTTNDYTTPAAVTAAGGAYQNSSELLYQSLSGMTNVTDTLQPGSRSYFPFKKTQLGVDSSGAQSVYYIKDPFGNSYGYFYGNGTAVPYNGSNSFDLWSTAGDTNSAALNPSGWVNNWAN